jgi:hypothetical protein
MPRIVKRSFLLEPAAGTPVDAVAVVLGSVFIKGIPLFDHTLPGVF